MQVFAALRPHMDGDVVRLARGAAVRVSAEARLKAGMHHRFSVRAT